MPALLRRQRRQTTPKRAKIPFLTGKTPAGTPRRHRAGRCLQAPATGVGGRRTAGVCRRLPAYCRQ